MDGHGKIGGSKAVHIKQAVMISPSEPTPTTVLPLSSLDSQLFLRFTIEYLLVYRPNSSSQSAITSRLKSALAHTLVPYFPFAGRIRRRRRRPDNSNINSSNRLEVACESEGQGVVFVEATADFTSRELERVPSYVDEWRDLLWFHVDDVLNGDPPLVLQLTWLSDGSAALAIGFNHCLCDGIGSAHFLRALAHSTTQLIHSDSDSDSCSCSYSYSYLDMVSWDRHLLDPAPHQLPPTGPGGGGGRRRQIDDPLLLFHPEFCQVDDLSGFMDLFTNHPLIPTSTLFTKRQIKDLKRRAAAAAAAATDYTAFEVVSAHVWRSWAASLRLNPNQTLKLLFSVDVRPRLKPPGLPPGFYGNGFVLGCAKTTAKDLAEKGLGFAAELIRKAKERVDDSYVREVVNLVSEMGSSSSCRPDPVGVLILSQWSRLGLDDIDFFGLGRPVSVGPLCTDRYCLLLPAAGDNFTNKAALLKVMVALPTPAANLYKHLINKF